MRKEEGWIRRSLIDCMEGAHVGCGSQTCGGRKVWGSSEPLLALKVWCLPDANFELRRQLFLHSVVLFAI